jgi:signal transduction histidine kinase
VSVATAAARRRAPAARKVLVALLVVLATAFLVLFAVASSVNPLLEAPVFHFYIVSFTSVVALTGSLLLVSVVGLEEDSRAFFVTLAFLATASVFTIHGLATPGILVEGFHPAISWSAWISLLAGTTFLTAATIPSDAPVWRVVVRHRRAFLVLLGLLYLAYVAVVIFAPSVLSDASARFEDLGRSVALATLAIGTVGALRAALLYRRGGHWLDGLVLVNLLLLLEAQISQLQPLWYMSWWMYHILLLSAFLFTVVVLVAKFEELRSFHLLRYYGATSAVIIALLVLVGGEFIMRLANRSGLEGIELRWRAMGVSAAMLAALFTSLLLLVDRADAIITRRTRALEDANADLKRSEQRRAELSDMVVHDLRGPLSAILLDLDLLGRQKPEGAQGSEPRVLARAQRSGRAMMGMVNNLLDISQMEVGALVAAPRPLEPRSLIADAVQEIEALLADNDLTVAWEIAPDVPNVRADRDLAHRVLQNLLSNAIKHSPRGATITVDAEPQGEFVRFEVGDEGPGVPEAERERIFDKYAQVAEERSARRGQGLGLAFCRMAIEAQGGRVWLRCGETRGSTFAFTLPAESRPREPGVSGEPAIRVRAAGPPTP